MCVIPHPYICIYNRERERESGGGWERERERGSGDYVYAPATAQVSLNHHDRGASLYHASPPIHIFMYLCIYRERGRGGGWEREGGGRDREGGEREIGSLIALVWRADVSEPARPGATLHHAGGPILQPQDKAGGLLRGSPRAALCRQCNI